ncbi:MAG: TRAP transporter small permease [Deltaproteobacteria bacterium]|nr:TRAP transporter small permease [Deltaproteobacteria bacterium]
MENPLNRFLAQAGRWLNIIGGTALTAMMVLTVADVILRAFGHPILGTYEMVSLLLALVAGFTIPRMSLDRVHVNMDFILPKLPSRVRTGLEITTRLLLLVLFVVIGINLFMIAREFQVSGEVSSTLRIPFYPIAYGLGVCCLLESLVFLAEIGNLWRKRHV